MHNHRRDDLSPDRRQALQYALGLMAAVAVDPPLLDAWLAQVQGATAQSRKKAGTPARYKPLAEGNPAFFNDSEYQTLTRMVDLIIPRTETPGAVDAGVPLYIDIVVRTDDQLGRRLRSGLAGLDTASRKATGRTFVMAGEAAQVRILEAMLPKNTAANEFFETVKSMTLVGYYSSEIGLFEELHFDGNKALSTFPGCPHGGHSVDVPARRAQRTATVADPARRWPFPSSDNITLEDL